jgi:hypothetical protein
LGRKYRLNCYADKMKRREDFVNTNERDQELLTRINEMRIAPYPAPGHRLIPKPKPFNPVAIIAFAVRM